MANASNPKLRVQLLGSGTIFREVDRRRRPAAKPTGACKPTSGAARPSTNWPATARTPPAGTCCTRSKRPKLSYVEQKLAGARRPGGCRDRLHQAASPSRSAPSSRARYITLGTDGFGRSDTREKLRHHFEVDRHWVTLAALKALADEGKIEREKVAAALVKYNLDPAKPNPMSV